MTNVNTVDKGWSAVAAATITAHVVLQVKDQPETRELIARLVFCDGVYDESFRANVLLATDAISEAYKAWPDGYVEVQVTFTNQMVNG